MTLTVRFDPAGQDELDAAHDWYERESPGVGAEFVAEGRRVAQDFAEWPRICRPVLASATDRGTQWVARRRLRETVGDLPEKLRTSLLVPTQ